MNANNRRSPIRTLNVAFDGVDHQVTAVPMTAHDLHVLAEDIELLDLPCDRNLLQPLKGFHLFNQRGENFGRLLARGGRMTAEWFDDAEQNDWLLASSNCRRLERGVIEILRLRDETARRLHAVAAQRMAEFEREAAAQRPAYRAAA